MPIRASRQDALAAVRRVVAAAAGRTIFLGVDGPGGAGKTALAAALDADVPELVVVHTDDFAAEPEWDWPRLRTQVLEPLAAGRPGRYQRHPWQDEVAGDWREVPIGRPVLIEGVSATRRELGVEWALQIWVDAPRDVRLRRAIERDGRAMLAQWTDVWLPSEEAYLAREHPQQRVDLIIDGTA
ncbi:uridine kinase [uncultured Jatrophihabitans sp.]|uniref:uridine kinase family protein n=1 Tax=uncultured Jatrophihabitans sp. TaxID=1610747 RepID=UPI0035CAC62E